MAQVPTIRVQDAGSRRGFITINASDFDPKKHVALDTKAPEGGAVASVASVPEPITAGSDAVDSAATSPEPITPAPAPPSGEQSEPEPEADPKPRKKGRRG